jgi:uncharacterized protein with von Willebrand factor type A (vWA) domain
MAADRDLLRAVGAALDAAQEEMDAMDDVAKSMGLGDGNGGNIDPKQLASVFKRVRNSAQLKRICELAGKYRRMAQSKQRQKVTHGYDDMIGVVMDGDISKLLPVELSSLVDPDLELDALRRIAERQAFCREYRGVEETGKGPIVICVDESGSMKGEAIANAKAFALALAWIARKQKRWCAMVSFSGSSRGIYHVLRPEKWDEVGLMAWLEHFYNGGTTMEVPLRTLPFQYWEEMKCPKGKTDMIILTDAAVDVPHDLRVPFMEWKKQQKCRLISLVLESSAGDMEHVSDETHLLKTLDPSSEGVGVCLGI